MAPPDYTLGGLNSGDSPWQGGVSLGMFLGAIPGAVARASALQIIDNYYRVIVSPQQQLTKSLLDIFGADLIGLWVGEDIVVSGADVTSWPGRVGPTLTNGDAGRYSLTTVGGRISLNCNTAAFKYLTTTLPTFLSVFAVATDNDLPATSDYRALVESDSTSPLTKGVTGSSTWYPGSWTTFRDGAESSDISTGQHVYSSQYGVSVETLFNVGGNIDDTRNWVGTISFVLALAAVPTPSKAASALLAIDEYYGIAVSPQQILAKGLLDIFGADLIGLWVGEDIVVDGSDNITSWPGRVGGVMTPMASYRSLSMVSGLKSSFTNDATAVRGYTVSGSSMAGKSFITVASLPALPFSGYNVAHGNLTDSLYGSSGTTLISGTASFVDGVATNDVSGLPSGLHILQSDFPGSGGTGTRIGGSSGIPSQNWTADLSFAMTLAAAPSAANRSAAIALLRSYYGI